ncbi:TerB family tellurite resistance protein [Oceanihabitans sp. IOP_32]|uniref:TerB family tellurite resistance protein n=1 Tax=Oceanihabitans sp. IOP_32 TaxID=2529032 RepID=UPI0012938221|nr:TerB family tellurite resistance protein [Oceanihabitans sp. IOP_32]QFZ55922.1 TerB family tellurite resistance protein [Oceanihabitans sp. IOP_32]
MVNKLQKLSLLSEMIAFAKYNKDIRDIEYNFLIAVAKQLGVSRDAFDCLIENPVSYRHLKSFSERIVQFHRLILLMNIKKKHGFGNTYKSIAKLYNSGLRMGLSPESISNVLSFINRNPNKIIPPDVLINIFKVQCN